LNGATLTAQWTANTYTITFNSAGGSAVDSITAAFGAAVTAPADPTYAGYTFNGWSPTMPTTMPLNGATLTAQWTANTYTITFNSAGGSAVDSITAAFGAAVTAPADPTYAGYTFNGWSPAMPTNMPLNGATLIAQWTANSYTVSFNAEGGTPSPSNITVTYASTYGTLPTVTQNGYTFNGWFTAATGGSQVTSSTNVTITAAQTLYAQWTIINYTLTVNITGNGTVGENPSQTTYHYGDTVILTAKPNTGWIFGSWSGAASGTTNSVSITITGNTTVGVTFIGPPVKLGFETSAQTITAGSPSGVITVQTEDVNGTPANVNVATAINLYTTSGLGTFATTTSGPFNGSLTSVTVPANQDSVSFYYQDNAAGTPTLTVTSFGMTSATQQETVKAVTPKATSVVILTPAQTLITGVASSAFTVQIQDASGNPFLVASSTQVNLYTTSGLGRFDTSATGLFNGSVTSVTVPAGSSSITFYYMDGTAGTPTLTVTSIGLTSGTQQETVNAAAPKAKAVVISSSAQTLTTGVASAFTVQIQDASGNPFTVASNTKVNLYTSSGTGRFDTSATGLFNGSVTTVTVLAGSSTATFYYKDSTAGTPTLTVTSTGLINGTQIETVKAPAKPTKLAISGPLTFKEGTVSGMFTVQIEDASGNPIAVAANTTINLYTTSGQGMFSNSASGPFNGSMTSVTVYAGNSTATFYYKDSKVGTPTITITSFGLTSASQVETITQ
jgi:uncharacterized repeat protein (TIGR02543 family)